MREWKSWGIKVRELPEYKYRAVWFGLKTLRLGDQESLPLPPENSEFYDIGIGNRCTTGGCPFCYVHASGNGEYYKDIVRTWKAWMKGKDQNHKPFQIAVGSTSEPTEHPDLPEFLGAVYETGVVPNFTTNGVLLRNDILEACRRYVGGVAVSFGNRAHREKAMKAVETYLEKGDVLVNIHHIISSAQDVEDFIRTQERYGDNIQYHVLLPMMPRGKGDCGFSDLEKEIIERGLQERVAFGAHYWPELKKAKKLGASLYPPESMSKNLIIKEGKVIITPSSFDLRPVETIALF